MHCPSRRSRQNTASIGNWRFPMARSLFLALTAILCFGCSAAASNNVRDEPVAEQQGEALDWVHESHKADMCMNPADSEYACLDGVSSATDISKFNGYHVIAFVKDANGNTFAHVADTCQHYFCAVDMPPPSDTQCKQPKVRTVGCCLARPVKPQDPSSK